MNDSKNDGKEIIAAASYYNKKYYFNEICAEMPGGIKKELAALCKLAAEEIQGIFTVSLDNGGSVAFAASGEESDHGFDEIGARLITDKLVVDNAELIKSIQLWHALNMTELGRKVKERLIAANEGQDLGGEAQSHGKGR